MRFLVAPLDWGLGHATRCIPIIKHLKLLDYEVIIAANGDSLRLLQQEFPELSFKNLPGYGVKYGKNRWKTIGRIFLQIPKILISINRERSWLRRFLAQEKVDILISDNRYGLYHPDTYCIFITHQLSIKAPFGKMGQRFSEQMHYRFINRFDACWVPDRELAPSLAGRLSHPGKNPKIPLTYIGPLSRFEKLPSRTGSPFILILLSGPEPARSVWEKKIISELMHYQGKAILLRGLPEEKQIYTLAPNITVFNHLPANELNQLICDSAFIISRAGYSTVMDLVKLGRKSILIPTPGQSEQEYLASHLQEHKIALCFSQRDFSLERALEAASHFPYQKLEEPDFHQFEQEIQGFIQKYGRESVKAL